MMSMRFRRAFSSKVLTLETMSVNLKEMEYAVRGLVPMTAEKIEAELAKNPGSYPFKEVLYCNIGNPQSVGQKPISYYREVTALAEHPKLLESLKKNSSLLKSLPFTSEAVAKARECLTDMKVGTGAYSHSQGVANFRKQVATFIQKRDDECKVHAREGEYSSNFNDIFLSNGASSAIQMLLTAVIANPKCGVMIPVPQYPIYSALTRLLNGRFVGYELDESKCWGLDLNALKSSLQNARKQGTEVRALVLINPGNPTGNVLSYEDIAELVKFCEKEKLVIIADEVYQENIYGDRPFVSVKKVVRDLKSSVEVASFHSTSKGYIGECGKRGGYMELVNFDEDIKGQLLKLASSGLCSNLIGQMMTALMVSPPKEASFEKEKNAIMQSLRSKSKMVHAKLNAIDGVSCQSLDGAMYAFPSFELSDRFIAEAKKANLAPDAHYALSLLRKTGLCAVPGSGFGQKAGTHHIRLTFLPDEEKLSKAMDAFADHHKSVQ